jgi:hypothetical protein
MTTTNTRTLEFALCEFQKDGRVFPVEMGIKTWKDAERKLRWQQSGQGEHEDWQIVSMGRLHFYEVNLDCFIATAQAEMRAQIAAAKDES